MAYYLVHARPYNERLSQLRQELEGGAIRQMQPFGQALHHALTNARRTPDGRAVWEEEDYCRPPLAQERAAVLDRYFADLTVEPVEQGQGWLQIDSLPSLWA